MKRIAVVLAGLLVLGTWGRDPGRHPVSRRHDPRLSGYPYGCPSVIDAEAGQQCGSREAALTWNQTGPVGPAGPPGLSGVEVVTVTGFAAGTGGSLHEVTLPCPAGKTVLAGAGGSIPFRAGWITCPAS